MHAYLEEFANECAEQAPTDTVEKFMGWDDLVLTLVGVGLTVALPELKEWVRLGAQASSVIRQQLKNKLVAYATEHELDFPAAELVAERVNEDNVGRLVEALESSKA